MELGNQILGIRKAQGMTQEEFGNLFHVTRQAVSNWEKEKTYPDLQTLVEISDRFHISLDTLIREDRKMVKTMDRERLLGTMKRKNSVIDLLMGGGTGLVISCLFSPASSVKVIPMILGILMFFAGGGMKLYYDRQVFHLLEEQENQQNT